MTDARTADGTEPDASPSSTPDPEARPGLLVSRRSALVGGALGLAAVVSAGEVDPDVALATTPPLTTSAPLPTTTAPEQVRLAWGADPTTQVTISFSAPGTAAMPAPTLAYSTSPITSANPGTVVALPAATPLSLATPRSGPTATSFTDGLSGQTTYHYHVPLTGLAPNTRYYYQASDGATPPASLTGSFQTAPGGRAPYRFTAFGDIGTPYTKNPSGYTWKESSDTSVFTVNGVVEPGDHNGPGLFHLMLADLSYANANPGSQPAIWRDYQINASRASAGQPWMPIQGNHEVELGADNAAGTPSSGQYFNGPYGAGNYLARHLLPDNGLKNHDGTSLQGSFYSFQVGTVLFICLNTNDVVYQNPQTVSTSTTSYAGTYASGATIPTGTVGISQYLSTGDFVADTANFQLVPDTAGGTPNLQTQWLKAQLTAARATGSSVDMIVVCEHHCALSTGPNNGVDLAIRAAWLPLYDEYAVDLVIGGHDHDYERSYPVRGFDAGTPGTAIAAFSSPFGSYAAGDAVNTRRPTVVQTTPIALGNGAEAWNTGAGTVFLQLGGAGAIAGGIPTVDTATGLRRAELWATNMGGTSGKQNASEVATWSANYDSSDNFGYAVFDVDPGDGPGQTKLTYQWFQVPSVPNGGSAPVQSTPYEAFVFTRFMPAGTVAIQGASTSGSTPVGAVLSAQTSGFASGASFAYQWLRAGTAIAGATGASYTTVAADGGQQLTVQLTAAAQSFPTTTMTSPAVSVAATTSTATPKPPATATGAATAPAVLPFADLAIFGEPTVGAQLRAQLTQQGTSASLAYQWLRDGVPIPGATSARYHPVAADIDHRISVEVNEYAAEYATVSGLSAAVTVTGADFVRTSLPTIHGSAVVGHSLTVEITAWSPAADFAFQWLLNGRPIHGATHPTLKLASSDVAKRISVEVTGTRPGYGARKVDSAHVVVARTTPRARKPRISGKALVGETLHAHIGDWEPGTEFVYRWYLGSAVIPGATGHALRVLAEYRGKRVTLEVTGRLAGHRTVHAHSASTRAIRRSWTLI